MRCNPGKFLIDAMTGFTSVLAVGVLLLPSQARADITIEEVSVREQASDAGPLLQGAGEFFGQPYHHFKVILLAAPDDSNVYTVVATLPGADEISNAEGYASWGYLDLSGTPPAAVNGWKVRIWISDLDSEDTWQSPVSWVAK